MPIYQYRCPQCGRREDGFAHVADRHTCAPMCTERHARMVLEICPAFVQGDIAPYRATVMDVKDEGKEGVTQPPVIGSRRAHKQFLKRNRLLEIGDSPIRSTKQFRKIHTDAERRRLREQMRPIVTEALRRGKR